MNILVVGLGAIGTVFSVSLKSANHNVYGLTKTKYINQFKNELTITGLFGSKSARLNLITDSPQILKNISFDLIIITVKSFDTEKAINQIIDLVSKDTLILIAQNGYGNYEIAGNILGFEKVILGRVIFGSRLIKLGAAEVTVIADSVCIGNPHKKIEEERLKYIAKVIDKSGIPTYYSERVYQILWDKIIYNSALNPLGAILRCNYGRLAECESSRIIMNKIIDEIFEVTKVHNIELNWKNKNEYLDHFYNKLIPPTKDHFPSMYYDITAHKKTEIDSLNGAIVRLAKEKGLSAPTNEIITLIIKSLEGES